MSKLVNIERSLLGIQSMGHVTIITNGHATDGRSSSDSPDHVIEYELPVVPRVSLKINESASQYATISDATQTGLDVTGSLTVEAWFLSSDASGSRQPIVSKFAYFFLDSGSSDQLSYMLRFEPQWTTPRIAFYASSDGVTTSSFFVERAFMQNVWYHVAATWDAVQDVVRLYIDGSLSATGSFGFNSIWDSSASLNIGRNGGLTSDWFSGSVDDVRIWNVVRTDQEITTYFDKPNLLGNDVNLKSHWKFDNTFEDSSGNANDATGVNNPEFRVG